MFVFRPWTPKHAHRHRPYTYDEMDAAVKRKATIDTKKIIAEVTKKLDSDKEELVERIAGLSMREWRCPVRGQSSPSPPGIQADTETFRRRRSTNTSKRRSS